MSKKVTITVGTLRPNWSEWSNIRGYLHCTCGQMLQTREAVRAHYDMGHFDKPQNIEIDVEEFKESVRQKWVERMEEQHAKKNDEPVSDGEEKEEGGA